MFVEKHVPQIELLKLLFEEEAEKTTKSGNNYSLESGEFWVLSFHCFDESFSHNRLYSVILDHQEEDLSDKCDEDPKEKDLGEKYDEEGSQNETDPIYHNEKYELGKLWELIS